MEPGKTAPTPSPLLTHVHNYVHICRTPNTISAAHTCKSPCTISPFCKRAKHHVQSVHTHHADAPSPPHTYTKPHAQSLLLTSVQNPTHHPHCAHTCRSPCTTTTAHTEQNPTHHILTPRRTECVPPPPPPVRTQWTTECPCSCLLPAVPEAAFRLIPSCLQARTENPACKPLRAIPPASRRAEPHALFLSNLL